ncbi:ketopantoate reductase family protein [Chitinophaga sp.]|uniref:ketopantoate reductase family protein n=1 Tax=Chitinophaga sp. TaxID=1869181 RepID=UPI002609DE30|nr:2-dehydropantoate 2-reductase [uncultured Chitinophaga sp.]
METTFIIGAGAIGQVLAAALTLHGREVVLLRGSTLHQATTVRPIHVTTPETAFQAAVRFDSPQQFPALEGPVILTNKSFGNAALAGQLKGKTGHWPLVLLQNGLEVEQPFLEMGFPSVYRCVLFATSQFAEDGSLRFKPVAPSPIGVMKGDAEVLPELAGRISTPLFPFRAETNIQPVIWKKAIANCVFNSICPLLETDNGIFHRNAEVMDLARQVIAECLDIAKSKGVELELGEVEESVLMISRMSDGQLISTYQDILQKRPTEIDTLNLAVARMAQEMGLANAIPRTRLLGELTKMKSNINR